MNIKRIYPYFGVTAIICLVFRFLQLMWGTDLETGFRDTSSPFSWLFILVMVISLLGLYIIPKLSYGVSKVSEISLPAYLAPISALLGSLTAIDVIRFTPTHSIFGKLEIILGLLAAAAFIILAGVLINKLPKKLVIFLLFPVFYFIVKLTEQFLTNILIATNPISSLYLFKIIFLLLFYLELLHFFFKENTGERIHHTLFIGLSAVLIVLADFIPSFVLGHMDKYSALVQKPDFSDIAFCIFTLMFSINIIKSVVKKSNALHSKTIEE